MTPKPPMVSAIVAGKFYDHSLLDLARQVSSQNMLNVHRGLSDMMHAAYGIMGEVYNVSISHMLDQATGFWYVGTLTSAARPRPEAQSGGRAARTNLTLELGHCLPAYSS